MRLIINGEEREIESKKLTGLIEELELANKTIAIAIDHKHIPKSQYQEIKLEQGQKVEVLVPFQGG